MKRLESMLELFMKITAGVVIVTTIFIAVFWGEYSEVRGDILWQILLVAAVCTLGSLILPIEGGKEVSKQSMLVRMILYYIYINIAVLVLGLQFMWYTLEEWKQVLGMIVAIAAVFLGIEAMSYHSQSRVADRMNEKLRER